MNKPPIKNTFTVYHVPRYRDEINTREASHHTDKTVFIIDSFSKKPVRHDWHSTYDHYFQTREAARDFLIRRLENEIVRAEERLVKARASLKLFKEEAANENTDDTSGVGQSH